MKAIAVLRRLPAGFRRLSASARSSLVWALVSRQRRWVRLYVIWSLVGGVFTFLIATGTVAMVDRGIVEQSVPLSGLRNYLITVAIFAGLLSMVSRLFGERLTYHLEFEARVWVYTRLESAKLERLDAIGAGQVVTRAMTDLRLIERVVRFLPTVIAFGPIILVLPLALVVVSPIMGFITVLAIPVNIVLLRWLSPKLRALSWAELNQRGEITAAMDEPVRGIRVVKSFGREQDERVRVRNAAAHAFSVAMTRIRLLARFDVLLKFFPIAVQALVLLIGARLVIADNLSLGAFLLSVQVGLAVVQISQIVDELAALWQFMRGAQDRLSEVLALGERPLTSGEQLPDPVTGLVLRGVDVELGGHTILRELDLECRPGELVVVHGAPRSGKSTLAATAAGLLVPSAGEAILDGLLLPQIDPGALRRAVRIVTEEPFLFATSVRHNLTLSSAVAASDEKLEGALHAAGADDFIPQLDGGLDSVLGDRGLTLSGGQRQRLGLARALVSSPRVLILDDALSAVNPSLEVEILNRIRAFAPEMSVISITRRRGPVAIADRVIELPDAPERPPATTQPAVAGLGGGAPFDPALAKLVAAVTLDNDRPRVKDTHEISEAEPRAGNLVSPFAVPLLFAAGALLVQNMSELSPQVVFGNIANIVEDGDSGATDVRALALVGVGLLGAAAAYSFKVNAQRFGQGLLFLIRLRVFRRLSRLGIDYYDRELPGKVAARVVNDIDTTEHFVSQRFFSFLTGLVKIVVALSVILALSTKIFPTVAVLVVVAAIATGFHLPVAMRALNRSRDELGEVVSRFEEDFLARHEIRASGAAERRRQEFVDAAWELRKARRWAAFVQVLYQVFLQTFGYIAGAIVLFQGGELVLAGTLGVGTALSLQLLTSQATQPLPLLASAYTDFLDVRVSWRRLRQPFAEPILPVEKPGAVACPALAGEIEFDGVRFAYPHTGREVIHDIDLHIPARTVCALVGYTGAGKSSIAKLLARMYDPDSGAVRVDGIDVRDYRINEYRSKLGIVPQDAFVFRGTVASNIRYGMPDATDQEVEDAARAVGAYELLSALENGFESVVDEDGRNLTAAQRQLIALARAWIAGPDILVLDEATANLDVHLENRVLEAVTDLGITTLMVTHRENVVARCPHVIVIDAGEIVQVGAPHELMGTGGAYDRLWATDAEVEADTFRPQPVVAVTNGRRTARTRRRTPLRAAGRVAGNGRRWADLSYQELYEEAQRRQVPGRSRMTKAELVKALRN